MVRIVSIEDLAGDVAGHVERAVRDGDTLVLTRAGAVVAELRPAPRASTLGDLPRILDNLPHLSPDDVEAFARDVQAAREEANRDRGRNRWEP